MTEAPVKVKTERPDEEEIRELAAKLVEANKAKALAASVAAAARPAAGALAATPGVGGQMGILNFLTRKPGAPGAAAAGEQLRPPDTEKKAPAPDEASWKGHFGWDVLGNCDIPYVFRSGEKYVAVRMVEVKLLNKYLNYLHPDIYSCTCIRSYYITEAESRLLTEINSRHCDFQFGRDAFTQKDLVVRLSDAQEFYNFLDVCYNKLMRGTTNSKDKCGFIRINKESVVPYTVRESQKFVPLFYFEGETDNLKLKADQLKGWDLSYLKFCCKVQGIRNELFASETCSVISLADIKSYFPPGTDFEEYWPNKVVDSQLLINGKGSSVSQPLTNVQWTRAPPAPPPGSVGHVGVGGTGGVALGGNTGAGGRGRRAQTQRHAPSASMQMPHGGLSAAAVQALTNGWNLPNALTQAQTQQVLRLAQAQAQAQAQAVARYSNAAAMAVAAASIPQHRASHQRNNVGQFSNNAMTMSMGQQAPPPPLVRSSSNAGNMNVGPQVGGSMNGTHGKRLTPIPDIPNTSGTHTPYKVQKALVEGTMVPCINAKPFHYSELLMTLPDLAGHFFPRATLTNCRAMIDALGITLYRPNSTQLQVLRNSGKCKSAAAGENGLALVQIRDVMQHMIQFKYMLRSGAVADEPQHAAPRPAHAHHPSSVHSGHAQQHSAPPAKRTRAT